MSNSKTNPRSTILVVDDYPDNLRTLSLMLQAEGYKLRKATSGAMALRTVQVQLPDLILLDIRMPEMDGFEVCATLKRSPSTRDIPILFISASDELDDKVKAFDLGGSDYITKPFQASEVLARVRHQLTIRQQHRTLLALYQQVQHLNTHLEEQVQERTQELQLAIENLQRLHQLKDDFLSTISHELRTPLANIRIVLQLLMTASRQGKDFFQKLSNSNSHGQPNKITQYLMILQDECDRELRLVQDLLDLQEVTAENLPLEVKVIDLHHWIPYVVEAFEIRTQQQQQTLVVKFAPDLPPLETDFSSLSRIVTELLTNACKYTPAGETIAIEASVEPTGNIEEHQSSPEQPPSTRHPAPRTPHFVLPTPHPTPHSNIVIRITNTGAEIPPEELPRVFDKFYRIPSSDPWKHSGTGLGLALVKKLVEHLQGTIAVTSTNNLTCFTLTLPLRPQVSPKP